MWSCFRIPKEREEAERHFLENGALLLEEMITSFNGRSNPIRSFSKQELKRATNNYHEDRVLHLSSQYELYKGAYEDRAISVKKYIREDAPQRYIGWCINEVAVASQMNKHKNVLKLLGCCLETEIPTLVYEFAASGCLYDHIFEKECSTSKKNELLSWESRLRIATEIADAVAYLHYGTSKSIIHRDIKTQNIFLDEHYVAKLFEFGLSISIPLGETYVKANVVGTYAFIAPETLSTRRYTEKSDVYSFGVVLVEILTGKMVRDIKREVYDDVPNSTRCLLFTEDNEEDIRMYLKANIVKGDTEQLTACVELAMRCIKVNSEERPSMMEAAKELKKIRRSNSFRSFSKQELKRATNNYHQDGLLHQDGLYKWYKGTYEDRVISVIKKLIVGYSPQKDIGWCINEVAVASHLNNHKNVLKLLGCCLETQAPTLVFEFAANGCLSYHIFEEELSPSYLSWESRSRIATEIADAVAYLHNGTSKLVIHRAINSYTILLDEHYIAKLFEFRLSIHMSKEIFHHGILGPLLLKSNGTWRFTEKSDVYSFGVVLFEILIGKRVLNILKEIYGVVESSSWRVNI
ncbi:hypothetical protein HHK36_022261 [Tetracentron sinense]|uniref:non-specific serine/threonine protein kinase n=1 Tax=Tetracentron sinense TaxID=13715 RepID=A0A835D6L5_TETSI|nr:hypothetical protein HHK36_022261 [Tetracentron sinense]